MGPKLMTGFACVLVACGFGCATAPQETEADTKAETRVAPEPVAASVEPAPEPAAPAPAAEAKPPATSRAPVSLVAAHKTLPENELLKYGAQKPTGYYEKHPQFHMYPDPKGPRYTIGRFGPVGLSLELLQPAFTMKIAGVQEGSPAAATGKLKKGQYIESINGTTLKGEDPRVMLGNLVTEAEAADGVLKMMVKDKPDAEAREVIVKIPALGAYSDTWPVDCPKSDKIVRNFAEFLDRADKSGYGAALFLLSTGEEKDLDVVRRWFHKKLKPDVSGYPWDIGYLGPSVCEYYLRTGDESVLPHIEAKAEQLKLKIYNGSWMGRGGANYSYMAGGHMNAAGVHCLSFLLLARECGAKVDEHTLQSCLYHFYRYAGHGNVSYGDGVPEGGFVDNGKTGGLAFAMAAAASLTPEGERSVYAKARDICASKSFYSTSWMFHGHTGGGIGEIWRGAAMGLVREKKPAQYQSFMNERRWVYELSRCYDGAFGITSGSWNKGGYDKTGHRGGRSWGNMFALVYTVPRGHLRMFGAPRSKYCKSYQLPKRPWGSAADEVFYSLESGAVRDGLALDMGRERLRTDASAPIMRRVQDPNVSDEILLLYAHHPDQGMRAATARTIANAGRDHLLLELLESRDPRGRHSGAVAISGPFKGRPLPAERLTDEMVAALARMINDPDESWWCACEAMNAIRLARPELIAPHVDRLAHWLKHEDWWLRKAAMTALTPVSTDTRYYRKILPIVGKMISTNERAVALSPVVGVVRQLQTADPEVQKYAVEVLAQAYREFPKTLNAPGGQDLSAGVRYLLQAIARNLSGVPGGFDALYAAARERFPEQSLPHKDLYLAAEASRFGPEVKKAFQPILNKQLVPEYIGKNRKRLLDELDKRLPGRTVDGLVGLYRKAGTDEYDWKPWGPRRDQIEWQYHSFDPQDGKLWERGGRYRKVEWPDGMDKWYTSEFDPGAAGWKTGRAPFANNDGKLAPVGSCEGNFCGCGEKPNTFWEKEVLMMRAEVRLPPVRDGYAYRLLVGGRSHVGGGDGSDIWIDGKYKTSRRKTDPSISGVGKRQGGRPWGFVIDDSFRREFQDGKVLLAASGFLRIHKRSGVKSNYQAFWFEQMKLPVIGEEDIVESAKGIPMLSTSYYREKKEEDKCRWSGTFAPNPRAVGSWAIVNLVPGVDEFDPEKRADTRRAPFKTLTLKNGGRTDKMLRIWSGDTLMDLERNVALKMTLKTVDGIEYLFVEAGGFSHRTKPGWKPPLCVMVRK